MPELRRSPRDDEHQQQNAAADRRGLGPQDGKDAQDRHDQRVHGQRRVTRDRPQAEQPQAQHRGREHR
ncbi:MAG TPA: hypothetical protein VKV73_25190 [Chloroflexota bacterium]|nr:hypothetical protein [Chloroflexota bacterium]